MSEFKNLTIMMGAVTETDSLRKTIENILSNCNRKDICEIIICYSPKAYPETLSVIKELETKYCDIPVVAFQQKREFMGCIVDAIEVSRGSHCILIASDMALDLAVLSELIEKAKAEPDVIHSLSRWMKGCKFYDYGKAKQLLNFCAQKFLSVLFLRNMTDFTIPVQIAPAKLYKSINFEETGFPLLLEMVLKPIRLGYKFTETPTNCYSRKEGKSNNSAKQTIAYFKVALHIRFMRKKNILLTNEE